MELIKGIKYSDCTGCGACAQICPKNAIKMQCVDNFRYPQVDTALCTSCGLCQKKCPVINIKPSQNIKAVYCGRAKDAELVKKSSSGGAFSLFADEIIKSGGVVFGAVFDSEKKKIKISSTEKNSLDDLRRSKYCESDSEKSFIEAKRLLDDGKNVLFCAMPCQIAGFKHFLGKDYENLIAVDFICGGAASSKFFEEHLNYLEKKYQSNVKAVNFRPKLYGWKTHSFQVSFKNGKEYKTYAYLDTYFRGFVYEHIITRNSCEECKFRSNHYSDIILADFWGYRQLKRNVDDKGLSLIISNSEKGDDLIKKISSASEIEKIPGEYADYVFKKQKKHTYIRQEFFDTFKKYGFEKAAKKVYMKGCIRFRLKTFIKRILQK